MNSFLKEHRSYNFKKLENNNEIIEYLDTLCQTSSFNIFKTPQTSKYMKALMTFFTQVRSSSRAAIHGFMSDYFKYKHINYCHETTHRFMRYAIRRAINEGYLIQKKQTFYKTKKKYSFELNEHSASIEPVFFIYNKKERIVHVIERHYDYLFCLELNEDSEFIYKTFIIKKISALYTNVF